MDRQHPISVIGIAGWKNSGKTTLVERLIAEFTRRGLRVSSIKHTHHEIQSEAPSSDSVRHRRAGACEVILAGHGQSEYRLDDIVGRLAPCDLVIVEGFKAAPIAKIEVRRAAQRERRELAPMDAGFIAVASDYVTDPGHLPLFCLNDVSAIADFITRTLELATGSDSD
jgi:molybdopterin-guanine dinucleotide biosynthesis protein B